MDPQLPTPPAMELPPPVENNQPTEGAPGGVDASEGQLSRAAEQPGAAAADPQAGAVPAVPPPVTTADPALTVPPAGSAAGSPAIADDGDLIEKEWVLKAKHIVEQTKHDPHEQTKAVNRVKADYLKKRYNKDIKLNEE